jgi:hypothetical protein
VLGREVTDIHVAGVSDASGRKRQLVKLKLIITNTVYIVVYLLKKMSYKVKSKHAINSRQCQEKQESRRQQFDKTMKQNP